MSLNGSNLWRGPDELLDLFGVDPGGRWAGAWCGLVCLRALGIKWPDYALSFDRIFAGWLRIERVSPVVFWSRVRAALSPLLEADFETLRALGVYPQALTSRALAEAVAAAMVLRGFEGTEADAAQLARLLRAEGGDQ